MKKQLSLLLLLFAIVANSQSREFAKPDYKLIEKSTKDKKSPLYFNTLFDRYTKADTTMTMEEKRYLYYGYSFTDAYSPYGGNSAYNKELNNLLNKDKLDKKEIEQLITLTSKILEDYPFNIRMKEYRIHFFGELGRKEEAVKETRQTEMIIEAMLSTGDGRTIDTSFYVINVGNEYELINILGFKYGGEQSLVDFQHDYLKLADNEYELEGLYFEMSRSMESLNGKK